VITFKQLYKHLTLDIDDEWGLYDIDFTLGDNCIIGTLYDDDNPWVQFTITEYNNTFNVVADTTDEEPHKSIIIGLLLRVMQWAFKCKLTKIVKAVCSVEF
jgi:hypothetical protein